MDRPAAMSDADREFVMNSCERDPIACFCHGGGWILTPYDVWHACPFHFDNQPHPETPPVVEPNPFDEWDKQRAQSYFDKNVRPKQTNVDAERLQALLLLFFEKLPDLTKETEAVMYGVPEDFEELMGNTIRVVKVSVPPPLPDRAFEVELPTGALFQVNIRRIK